MTAADHEEIAQHVTPPVPVADREMVGDVLGDVVGGFEEMQVVGNEAGHLEMSVNP